VREALKALNDDILGRLERKEIGYEDIFNLGDQDATLGAPAA
jgi:hypothetical protein